MRGLKSGEVSRFTTGSERPKLFIFSIFMAALLASIALLSSFAFHNLTWFYLREQDVRLILVMLLVTALAVIKLKPRDQQFNASYTVPLIAAACVTLVCIAGHYWLLSGYHLSRDEQMAVFDAAIFANGHLVRPIPALWRDHSEALNSLFLYPAEARGAWVSSYLPMNAALRAVMDVVAISELTGPLMTGIGAIALWACARKIWPEQREAPLIALLLYLGSGQILFTGMTAFAMPAHLTLNLIWLWLFLQRTRLMDALALIIAFVAVGLHQPIMHPLFAAPILCLLLWEKAWARAAFFLIGYALIGLFWMLWPGWIWLMVQALPGAQQPAGVDFITRLVETLMTGDPQGLQHMGANLLRFMAWQHILFVPLLLIGFRAVRTSALAAALAAGFVLMPIVMFIILPYQGYGFGYRYLHGLIGNGILLCVFGWVSMAQSVAVWRSLLVRTTLGVMLVIMPLQAWMTYAGYKPFTQLSERIAAMDVDYVILGEGDALFLMDLAINDPALEQRPLRLLREKIKPELIVSLCAQPASVRFLSAEMIEPVRRYFSSKSGNVDAENAAMAGLFKQAGCTVQD